MKVIDCEIFRTRGWASSLHGIHMNTISDAPLFKKVTFHFEVVEFKWFCFDQALMFAFIDLKKKKKKKKKKLEWVIFRLCVLVCDVCVRACACRLASQEGWVGS